MSLKQIEILREGNEWASAFIQRPYVGWLTHAAAGGNNVSVDITRKFAFFWTL